MLQCDIDSILAAVFGDPHFHTFDDLEYTFNGKGEFVLVRANSNKQKLDVQGRFEGVPLNRLRESRATMLTAVAGIHRALASEKKYSDRQFERGRP